MWLNPRRWMRGRRPREPDPDNPFDLDTPLLRFSPYDIWTFRDACESVQIFGAIGSGKTSGSGKAIATALLRRGCGGLVLCAKPSERELWEDYAKQTGRSKDLIIVSPENPYRFNWLDYELRREGKGAGQTENLVNLFSQIADLAAGRIEQSSSGDPFWSNAMKELIRNSIGLLALSKGTLRVEDIYRLIAEAPQNLAEAAPKSELNSDTKKDSREYRNWEEENFEHLRWSKNSFTAQCIREADEKKKNVLEAHDFEAVKRYWTKNFPALADKTRTGVIASFTGLADTLSHGLAWQLFGTETNIVPEMAYDGAIFIIDLSIQDFNETGKLCQGIFKLMFQRAILRREVNSHTRPCFIWADESQHFLSSTDYLFLSTARSQRACMVYLTQNISNYYSVLGSHGRDQANALLGNFQTKILHSNGDSHTNQYAAETIGQHWITTSGFNTSTTDNGGSRGASGQQTLSYKVLPSEFTTLKKGGPTNNMEVEAIIFQGGRIFKATGDTYIRTVFRQERKP